MVSSATPVPESSAEQVLRNLICAQAVDDAGADEAIRNFRAAVLDEAAKKVQADADRMDRVLGHATETASTKRSVAVHLRSMAAEERENAAAARAAQTGGE